MSNLISSDATKIATSYWGCMFHWGGWCSVTTIVIAVQSAPLLGYGIRCVLVIIVFMPTSYFLSKHIKVAYKGMMSFHKRKTHGRKSASNSRGESIRAENSNWLEIINATTGATMAAISTNAEDITLWHYSVNAVFPGILHLRGEGHRSQDFYLPFMVCTVAKFNGAYTGHKHSECSRY